MDHGALRAVDARAQGPPPARIRELGAVAAVGHRARAADADPVRLHPRAQHGDGAVEPLAHAAGRQRAEARRRRAGHPGDGRPVHGERVGGRSVGCAHGDGQ